MSDGWKDLYVKIMKEKMDNKELPFSMFRAISLEIQNGNKSEVEKLLGIEAIEARSLSLYYIYELVLDTECIFVGLSNASPEFCPVLAHEPLTVKNLRKANSSICTNILAENLSENDAYYLLETYSEQKKPKHNYWSA